MSKIIPWNLPEVAGGSVGGYTPAPTPPAPTNYPYDLDNMSLVASIVTGDRYTDANLQRTTLTKGKLEISGITILDSTSVSSVIATVDITAGTGTWTDATNNYSLNAATIDVDISACMTSLGGTVYVTNATRDGNKYLSDLRAYNTSYPYPTFVSTTGTITVTAIKVYNSNGIVIQEWTP